MLKFVCSCLFLVAGVLLGVGTALAAESAATEANGGEPACGGLFGIATPMDLEHAWSGTPILRKMEAECVSSDQSVIYWQLRGGAESLIGNHEAALADFDRPYHLRGRRAPQSELPPDAASTAALPYIAERATEHRVVMVNERHHVSTDRLLTLELLGPLYEQGFRYLAVEALWEEEQGLGERGYPIRETGGYVNDVVFAELLREALALRYEIVPYEARREQNQATETMNRQQARDYWQAQNLIAATLNRDADAKVLVHCGYAHLHETATDRWTPMAHYLHQATGLDPLTVDQTAFAERGTEHAEHGWRLDAEARGLVKDGAAVLLDAAGELLRREHDRVDMRVLNPRTQYVNGRPVWMRMGGRRAPVTIDTPECASEACVVSAFDPAWVERAVPYDRVEVAAPSVDMYLPSVAEVEVRAFRLDGSAIFRRLVALP